MDKTPTFLVYNAEDFRVAFWSLDLLTGIWNIPERQFALHLQRKESRAETSAQQSEIVARLLSEPR